MLIGKQSERWLWVSAVAAVAAARFGGLLKEPGDWEPSWLMAAAALVGLGAALVPQPEKARLRALRGAAVTVSIALLLPLSYMPSWLLGVIVLWATVACLRRGTSEPGVESLRLESASRARWMLGGLIAAVAIAAVCYRLLVAHNLEQTSALFVGIPAVLAIVVVLASRPKSLIGTICTTIAIALLVSGIFLGEGFVCILMSSPIFFALGIAIGQVVERARRRRAATDVQLYGLLLLALVPLSLEGTLPELSFPREETVAVERVVAASPEAVGATLAETPRFDSALPPFLRLGFPRPVTASGAGLAVGDCRSIHFAGGEGKPGDLRLEVVESSPGRVRFRAMSDSSKIAHWLAWREADVEWASAAPVDSSRTRVRWTLRYRRDLDPAWYFAPWERYAARLAAEVLITDLATPRGGNGGAGYMAANRAGASLLPRDRSRR
jgi:hypothetical protein